MEIGDFIENGCVVAIFENGFITLEDGLTKVFLSNNDIDIYKNECCYEICNNANKVCEWINTHPDYNIINIIKNGITDISNYTIFYYNNIESDISKARKLGKLVKKANGIDLTKFFK